MQIDWNNAEGGSWAVSSNWGTPPLTQLPQNGDMVLNALAGKSYTVTSYVDEQMNSLAVGEKVTLDVNNGKFTIDTTGSNAGTMTVNSTLVIYGELDNSKSGTLNFNNATLTGTIKNSNVVTLTGDLKIQTAASLLDTGSEAIQLSGNIKSNGNPATFTNGSDIWGLGQIGDSNLTVSNTGTINATSSAAPLTSVPAETTSPIRAP
jgi:hypothetical protein